MARSTSYIFLVGEAKIRAIPNEYWYHHGITFLVSSEIGIQKRSLLFRAQVLMVVLDFLLHLPFVSSPYVNED